MALYFAATVSFLALLVRRADALSTFSLTITAVGCATHTVALVTRCWAGSRVRAFMKPYPFSPGCSSGLSRRGIPPPPSRAGIIHCSAALVSLVPPAPPDTVPTLQPVFRTLGPCHVEYARHRRLCCRLRRGCHVSDSGWTSSQRFNVLYSKLPALDFLTI
jgi:hypothetical protein